MDYVESMLERGTFNGAFGNEEKECCLLPYLCIVSEAY